MTVGPTDPAELQRLVNEAGSIADAARSLGIAPQTLNSRCKKLGVQSPLRSGQTGVRAEEPEPEGEADPLEVRDLNRRLDKARAENQLLRKQLRTSDKHHDLVRDVARILEPLVSDYTLPPVSAVPPPEPSRNGVTLVLHLTDWHWGELVDPATVDGLNAYSPAIAASRVQHVADVVAKWIDNYQRLHGVDELVIFELGDQASGQHNLHPDSADEAGRIAKQSLDVSLVEAMLIAELAPLVPKVTIEKPSSDNHTRSTRRPPTGQAALETSWGTMIAEMTAALLTRQPNVDMRVHRSYKAKRRIYDRTWAGAHGHMMKGGGGSLGIPVYALKRMHDATVARSITKARSQAVEQQLAADMLSGVVQETRCGHFHFYAMWGVGDGRAGILPSLKGVDGFVVDQLEKYSPAGQVLEVAHPEHGIIAQHEIGVQHIMEPLPCRYTWGALEDGHTAAAIFDAWEQARSS